MLLGPLGCAVPHYWCYWEHLDRLYLRNWEDWGGLCCVTGSISMSYEESWVRLTGVLGVTGVAGMGHTGVTRRTGVRCATLLVSLGVLGQAILWFLGPLRWAFSCYWCPPGMGHTSGTGSHGSCYAILLVLLGALGPGEKVALGLLLMLGALG